MNKTFITNNHQVIITQLYTIDTLPELAREHAIGNIEEIMGNDFEYYGDYIEEIVFEKGFGFWATKKDGSKKFIDCIEKMYEARKEGYRANIGIEYDLYRNFLSLNIEELNETDEETQEKQKQEIEKECLKMLKDDYEWQTSEEYAIEYARDNDYKFNVQGTRLFI